MKELLFAGLFAFTLTASALAADTAVKLTADDLLRLARPSAGECYAVKPPANVTSGPERLFACLRKWEEREERGSGLILFAKMGTYRITWDG
jgi:hypothetical protein